MQIRFVLRNKLPSVVPCTIACSPTIGSGLGKRPEARVTVMISAAEALESRIASVVSMPPAEARDLAARLIEQANEADRLLTEELRRPRSI